MGTSNPSRPKVSIIVPCKVIGKHAVECVTYCNKLDYPNFEILVLPDENLASDQQLAGATIIPTGSMGPSEKRNIGAQHATGGILAFIDDDAFPRVDWLLQAIPQFDDPKIGAVGGPGVTPASDGLFEQASGKVYESLLVSGPYTGRYTPTKQHRIDDYPSCNLLVRRSAFFESGGFDTNFWPGEDTKLCLAITKTLGLAILYSPNVLVYHHRRNILRGHLKQVASYALHRGYFAKRFPETSRRLTYSLPSLFLIGLLSGTFALFIPIMREAYLAGLGLYLILNSLAAFKVVRVNIALLFLVFIGTIITHLTYGAWFLKGLMSRTLTDSVNAKGTSHVG